MSTEQATELLSILRDLHGLTGAVLAGVGLLIGIALWFIMFHSTSRSGFWGGVVLLGFLFSSTGASAEWTYTQYKNAIDSQSSGNVDYPSNSQWTAYKNLGLSPQAHWESWWNNGNPPLPYQFNTYTNKLVSDTSALLVSHDLWGQWGNPIANELGPLAVPTFAQWAAWGGTDAQKLTFWHDWWGYWELHNPPSSQFITDFVAAGTAGQYVFQAPAGGGGGGGNGSETYNLWGQWSSLIAPAIGVLEVPSFEQWSAWGGTDPQKLTFWQNWWGHWELRNPPSGRFIADFVSAGIAGEYVFVPPSVQYDELTSQALSYGYISPTRQVFDLYVSSGGDPLLFLHDFALIHYSEPLTAGAFATSFTAASGTGARAPLTGSSEYVTFARKVLALDQVPPTQESYDLYKTVHTPDSFLALWKLHGDNDGPEAFKYSLTTNAALVTQAPGNSLSPCCGRPPVQPCINHYWDRSYAFAYRNLQWSVTIECGQCATVTGRGERRCRYYVNGNEGTPSTCIGQNWQYDGPWEPYDFLRSCTGNSPCGPDCMSLLQPGYGEFRSANCLEYAILSAGCRNALQCNGRTLDCALCDLLPSTCSLGDCAGCRPGDPPDPGCDHSTDADCDGCPNSEEPCDQECPDDADCDDCPDDRDQIPHSPGGECSPEEPPPCEGDEDCDDCPDADENPEEGNFSGNPACQCDTTPGDGSNDDHDCNGCPEDFDNETRTRTNQDCGPCKDKGGDSDRDGCCDDDDTSPNDSSDEEKCEDCTQDVLQKIEELSQRIAEKWLPAFNVGAPAEIAAVVNLRGISGVRTQWRVDFKTCLVEGTFADYGFMRSMSFTLMQTLEQARQLVAYVIYIFGFLCCWYIANSLGGGNS